MVNVFSFCIYGPENPKYYVGLLKNIELINQHFADWKIFVYVGADVSATYIETLRQNPSVVLRETGIVGHENSVHRFFAIDEPDVSLMMVRDADSRVHWKDRWAIREFLRLDYDVHIVRDHAEHMTYILAGLWGMKKNAISESIREMYMHWTPKFAGSGNKTNLRGFGVDQNFLSLELYPKIKSRAFVHYSNRCLMVGEVGVEFPFEWKNDTYCGRVELEYLDKPDIPHARRSAMLNLPNVAVRLGGTTVAPPAPASTPVAPTDVTIRNPPLFLNFLNKK